MITNYFQASSKLKHSTIAQNPSVSDKETNPQSVVVIPDDVVMEPAAKKKNRYFNTDWEEEFFVVDRRGIGFCLICHSANGVSTYHRSAIKRHYDKFHKPIDNEFPRHSQKRINKLQLLKSDVANGETVIRRASDKSFAATKASYVLAWHIAKKKKPFNTGEMFKEMFIDMAPVLFSSLPEKSCSEVISQIGALQASDDTVSSRVKDISASIKDLTIKELKASEAWSFAIDSSTDIKDVENLVIYVSYITMVDENPVAVQRYLTDIHMHGRMTGKEMWREFEKYIDYLKIDWKKLVNCGTDGCPAMIGKDAGFVAYLRKKAPGVLVNHCILHLQALAAKRSLDLDQVMQQVVDVVSAIMSEKLPHRQFQQLLVELESNYTDMVYFTQVRWLSKGKVLDRFVNLLEEIRVFIIDQGKSKEFDYIFDSFWVCKVRFLADIVDDFNDINLTLQSHTNDIADAVVAIKDLIALIDKRSDQLASNSFNSWTHLKEATLTDIESCRTDFNACLDGVKKALKKRFTENKDFEFMDQVTRVLQAPLQSLFDGDSKKTVLFIILI